MEQIISTGTCGVLADIEENAFLVPVRALRDEGTSYHYVAPSRYMDVHVEAISAIEQVLEQLGIPYEEVMTLVDRWFLPRNKLKKLPIVRKKAVQLWRWSVQLLQQLPSFEESFGDNFYLQPDSLADLENYDSRDWGSEAFDKALELCLEIVSHM